VSAATGLSSTGRGGNLTINAKDSIGVVGISNDGRLPSTLSVRSQGKGAAGNLTVNSPRISVKDRGAISATANAVDGGNITLNTNLLLLRSSGVISATAGLAQGEGNGGNVTIHVPNGFIVAVKGENSDITANAFKGSGGKVQINATGIFGIAPLSLQDLERLRPFDLDPRQLSSNDITAVSQANFSPNLSGQVSINTPDVDPSQGLVILPTQVFDASQRLISSSCAAFADEGGSKFTITGRGGLPPNPDEPLTSDVIWTDTRLPDTTDGQHGSRKSTALPPSQSKAVEILPATGWVFNDKGEVTLISHISDASSPQPTPTTCPKQ